MRILEIRENQINFKKIQLNKVEQEKAAKLLADLPSITVPSSIEKIKLKLFDIFDSHLQKEASRRSKKFVHKEDFLQSFYLKFFEFLDGIREQNILPENFIDLLNKIKPDCNDYKDKTVSLYRGYKNPFFEYENNITEENLPVYSSEKNALERRQERKKISHIVAGTVLTKKEERVLNYKKYGNTFVEIAKKMNLSETNIGQAFLSAIAKIQRYNNILPEDFEMIAQKIKQNYEPAASVEKIIDVLVKHPDFLRFFKYNGDEAIKDYAEILKVFEKDIVEASLKMPTLTHLRPETIKQNINKTSKLLKIDEDKLLTVAISEPHLFIQKPETLKENITKLAELLKLSEQKAIEVALRAPSLFIEKVETIKQNIIKSIEIFSITEQDFIKASLRKPQLFYLNPEKLKQNIEVSAKCFNVSEKEFVAAALKQPNLFFQKTETLEKNVLKSAKIMEISKEDFIKIALKRPELFYLKPKTIQQNISQSAKAFKIAKKDFIKAGLRKPQLFYQKPETLKQNIKESAKVFNVSEKEFVAAALLQPSLFYQKAETLRQNIIEIAKAFKISEKEMIKIALKQPTLFQLKPENIEKKIKINNFYHKIYDKYGKKNIQFAKESVEALYLKPLVYLVRKNLEGNVAVNSKNIVEVIKNNSNRIFTFNLPQDECTTEFIQYTKEFFAKNIGVQNYKFFIEGKEII